MSMDWNEWAKRFWKYDPRMAAVYDTIIVFASVFLFFIFSLITVNTVAILIFTLSLLAFYAVFTDEVAHLYPYINSPIDHRMWIFKMFHGRTHDVYGILLGYALLVAGLFYTHVFASYSYYTLLLAIALSIMWFIPCFFIIYNFYENRFYH